MRAATTIYVYPEGEYVRYYLDYALIETEQWDEALAVLDDL